MSEPESGGPGWQNWALSDRGVCFWRTNKPGRDRLEFLELASKKSFPSFLSDKGTGWGLSMSRDSKSIFYVQSEFAEANLMLVKNFR